MNAHTFIFITTLLTQTLVMALYDTRNGGFSKAINVSVLITGVVITYLWGGLFWLVLPLLIIPIIAGIIGGIISGYKQKREAK